jgi:hypothetical protein
MGGRIDEWIRVFWSDFFAGALFFTFNIFDGNNDKGRMVASLSGLILVVVGYTF